MRAKMLLGLVAAAAAGIALFGCCAEPEVAAAPPPPRAAPPPPPRAEPCGPVGTASALMVLPSGDSKCGVVSVEKAAPGMVVVGAPFDYTIRLTNITKAALKGVVLKEKLGDNFTLVGTNPKAGIDGQTLVWNVGTLEPGQSQMFTIRGSAKASGSVLGCTDVTYENPSVCLAIKAVQPALQIAKAGPAEVLLCDPISYKITVTNTGTGPACNVVVTDTLPDGLKALDGRQEVTMKVGTLQPGESRAFAFEAKAAAKGTFTNSARAAGDGGLAASSAPVSTKVVKPELTVAKTGPNMRYVGRPATYEIAVTNSGDGPARNTVLTDTIPAGATLASASDNDAAAGGKVTWQLGDLNPGQSKKVSLTLNLMQQGAIRNMANAIAYCAQGSGEAVTEVKGIPAILLECVDQADPIEVGAQETYVITVTNQGSAVDRNIVVDCTLPPELDYVSSSGPTQATAEGRSVKFAPLKALDAGTKAVYKVVTKGTKAGDVRFKVSLTSDMMETPATETESTHIYSD